jgi:isopenicillin N synthase-like dioxygenase
MTLPVIDIAPLMHAREDAAARSAIAAQIEAACRSTGFFYIQGHGVTDDIIGQLDAASRRFFALPHEAKQAIAMEHGGRAWRGWFPLEGELTSGVPDRKEGLYFGIEHSPQHPRVQARWPLHGANLWPNEVPELRPAVEAYMRATIRAAHALTEGIALALGLDADYFERTYTAEPTVLFRIFRYPPQPSTDDRQWGVGEHTDYGLLTLLAQDQHGGLQVRTPGGWIDAPPIAGTLVCNIGDMLDRLTGGWFKSTPHRVLNTSGHERLSFPLFFDPDFAAHIEPLPRHARIDKRSIDEDRSQRWDRASVHDFSGTYGDYLLTKVSKVFPQLREKVL